MRTLDDAHIDFVNILTELTRILLIWTGKGTLFRPLSPFLPTSYVVPLGIRSLMASAAVAAALGNSCALCMR